jgi:hypothetical protein
MGALGAPLAGCLPYNAFELVIVILLCAIVGLVLFALFSCNK